MQNLTRYLVSCLLAAKVLSCPVAWGQADGQITVEAKAGPPIWLEEALENLALGVDAYYAARFDEALVHLDDASRSLVQGHEMYPVDRDTVCKAVVYLILTLDALERDEEAAGLAAGLAEVTQAPWYEGLDLSPAAMALLDGMAAGVAEAPMGTLTVLVPGNDCAIMLDSHDVETGAGMFVLAGTHWVQIGCEGVTSDHFAVLVPEGEPVTLDLTGLDLSAVKIEDLPGTGPSVPEMLLDRGPVKAKPWFGHPVNLVLQAVGIVAIGVGAGLLAGSIDVEREAFTTAGLSYGKLEDRATDMQISGWALVCSGGVSLLIGVIRVAMARGEGA